jgi:hypothetical protein
MQLGKLDGSQADQSDSCKTGVFGPQSKQRVTNGSQNRARAKPIEQSVYIGRERLGRFVQSGPRKYKAFDADDRPLGNFRVCKRMLAAIRRSARS